MNKPAARNALVIVGAWSLSRILTPALVIALIPISRRLIFRDDAGIILLWVWDGIPASVMAAAATLAVVWLLETNHPWRWIAVVAMLYVYSGTLDAIRTMRQFRSSGTADLAGIVLQAVMPIIACIAAMMWSNRRYPRGQP